MSVNQGGGALSTSFFQNSQLPTLTTVLENLIFCEKSVYSFLGQIPNYATTYTFYISLKTYIKYKLQTLISNERSVFDIHNIFLLKLTVSVKYVLS